jgi:hypothetical protein
MVGRHQNKLRIWQKTKKRKRIINLVIINLPEIPYLPPGQIRVLIEGEDSYPGKDWARFVKVHDLAVFFQTDDFIVPPKMGEFLRSRRFDTRDTEYMQKGAVPHPGGF